MSYMWKITMSSGGGTVRTFASGLSKEEAEEIQKKLEAEGAKVTLK